MSRTLRLAWVVSVAGVALTSMLLLLFRSTGAQPVSSLQGELPLAQVDQFGIKLPDSVANPSTILRASQVVVQVGDLYTWTQDTAADWGQGTLQNLNNVAVSGTLRLEQHGFGENTTLTPRGELASGQDNPAIAIDSAGNAYAVWADQRNGNYDIYFAYRPAGGAWGANVRVNDDNGITDQLYPALAVDGSGNAYAVWGDERNGNRDIYFATRPAGGTWGTNVKVSDDIGTMDQWFPDLAVDGAGNAYAVWTDKRNGNEDIYFAYRPVGSVWGTNVRVNDDIGTARQYSPDIVVDGNGNAYAVWTDARHNPTCSGLSCNTDIYFAYRSAGSSWGANVRVNDDVGTAWQGSPTIAVNAIGNAYAVWEDYRNSSNNDIYAAYRPVTGTWGTNTRVNNIAGSPVNLGALPSIAIDSNSNAYVLWTDGRNGYGGTEWYHLAEVYFSYHAADSTTWESSIKVNDAYMSMDWGYGTAIAVDASGNAYAVWADTRNRNADIYFAYRPNTGGWSANSRVNDDSITAQFDPHIAMDSTTGAAYAIWDDARTGNSDVYFATRPTSGLWSANVKVNDDTITASQSYPAITVDSNGNSYAVWQDYRNGNGDIYFAYHPASGAWGTNVKVDDDISTKHQFDPALAVDGASNAYAVWYDYRNSINWENPDIYFAYRPAGSAWGANVKVNDDISATMQSNPAIAVDTSGNAYAVWTDGRNGNDDIYFAYRPAGGAWGANVKVNDDMGTTEQEVPSITVDGNGNAYAVWHDSRNGNADIYFAYRPAGGAWGTNVKVNDDTGTANQWSPAIAVASNGNAYAVWYDYRSGNSDIYFAYRSAGGTWGTNLKVNKDNSTTIEQLHPTLAVDGSGNAHAIWEDGRFGAANLYSARSLPTPEYASSGSFTSPELDTGVTAAVWQSLTYSGTVPPSTFLTFEARSRTAGGVWSEWKTVTDPITSPPGQYLQYRVTFSTMLTNATPTLDWVKITYRSAGTPSAPHWVTPCGVTNRTAPTLTGSATAGATAHLFVNGAEVVTTAVSTNGTFAFRPGLSMGSHIITVTAENEQGQGPASAPLALTVNPALRYDPINVRAGQWSHDGWLMSVPRDATGCANPDNAWRVWPRVYEQFRVEVPVSYTISAAVTVTIGTQTITLTQETGKVFVGVFQPPIPIGAFIITVTADGATTVVTGGPVLIDPDGYVYEASGTISDTIPGVKVSCYYSDTHSGQWVTWDAWNYTQINPQATLNEGYYSFYVPPGTYRVTADKEGYVTYASPDLIVVDTPLRHNIPLERVSRPYHIFLPVVLKN